MNATRLAKDVHREQCHDDARAGAGEQRDQRCREDKSDVAIVHPLARSTSRTLNGDCPFGVTSKDSPQWPTITSAGAACEYTPGAVSGRAYDCVPISMSSIVAPITTSAPRTGLPPRVIRRAKLFWAAARFGCTCSSTREPFFSTTCVTGPGPTCALAPPTFASAFAGGGRLESTAAAATALTTSSTSPATRRRSNDAAPVPSSGR